MTFKIFVGGARIDSNLVLGECWRAVRARERDLSDARAGGSDE